MVHSSAKVIRPVGGVVSPVLIFPVHLCSVVCKLILVTNNWVLSFRHNLSV